MPDKDEIRIRKATNLYDLLDDGIANNSDIRELVEREDEITAKAAIAIAQRPAPQRGSASAPEAIVPKARSWSGILLGMLAFVAGAAEAIHPTAMNVWHDRARYGMRPFFEHVDPERARLYGICMAIFGLGLLAYSLVRMPRAGKKPRD
jgi:hypothetical protein